MADMGIVPYFICGGVGGIFTVLVGHPFDTLKVRMQTASLQTESLHSTKRVYYSGMWDCAKKTFIVDGPRGFYKGMATPLMGVAPVFAVSFMGYRVGKELLQKDKTTKLGYIEHFCAGAFSGLFTTVLLTPGERIKCLLQIQSEANKLYNGPVDCFKKLYKEGGVKTMYRGASATLLRDVPASGLYFLTYEVIREKMTQNGAKELSITATILAGGFAGIAHWIVGMPFDVLKSRIQIAPEGLYDAGMRDAAAHLIETEGLFAFYRGLAPVLLRAFPANAACFLGFEMCRHLFDILSTNFEIVL